jgi:integrase
MAERRAASNTTRGKPPAPKRAPCSPWLDDIRKAFKRHRMGRPGWFVGEHRDRLRLTSHELPPRPGEAGTDQKVVRALILDTAPGPSTIGSAITEACKVFDAVMDGSWRWPEDPHRALQADPSQPLPPATIAALQEALRLQLVGEQIGESTWNRTWRPYLKRLQQRAQEQHWSSDTELLQAFLRAWEPNSRARQMAFDRARRLWKEANRPWPDAVASMRGNGKAAVNPEGARAFTDQEIQELRARLQRSRRLTPADLVAWDLLVAFGLRPAELKGLELEQRDRLLVATVTRQKKSSKGSSGARSVPAVPPASWPADCFELLARWKRHGLPPGMVAARSPGEVLAQQLARLKAQPPVETELPAELVPYAMRHAYALRVSLDLKLHVREAAELMGHSPAVHLATYGRRLDGPALQRRVAALLDQRRSS